MKFRKTTMEDVLAVLEIIGQAQEYLKQKRIEQWQNGYPNRNSMYRGYSKRV